MTIKQPPRDAQTSRSQEMDPFDTRPVPDPTILTTQQLYRELGNLKEYIISRMDSLDNALVVHRANNNNSYEEFQKDLKATISALKELHEEKFHGIQTQFSERDSRIEQTARDSKLAVEAAFQAAKEAVGEQNKSNATAIAKSEAAFTKQTDQMAILITTMGKTLDDKIDDLKGRLTLLESRASSSEGVRKGFGDGWGILVGFMGIIFGIIAASAAIIHIVTSK